MKNILDRSQKKSDLLKLLKEIDFNFEQKLNVGDSDDYIIGFLSNESKEMDMTQFFSSIENTKNNLVLSLKRFLDYFEEDILPKSVNNDIVESIFNPYNKDFRSYYLENAIIRMGSLWDQVAHLFNIYYDLKIDKKRVSAKRVFSKKVVDENPELDDLRSIYDYFNNDNNALDMNNHGYMVNLRNSLIHYCDLNALKFISNYLFDRKFNYFYPVGYFIGPLMVDFDMFINFSKDIFKKYLDKIDCGFWSEEN